MKQLAIFDDCTPLQSPIKKGSAVWKLFVDGAARKNPGIAGAGVYVLKHDEIIFKKGYYLGHKTNNQAEYLALLLGLFYCKKHIEDHDTLYIISDSELLIKQMKHEYKVRNSDLIRFYNLALIMIEGMNYSFCHVKRELNTQADEMANQGIDKRTAVPSDFIRLLHAHDISI